MDAYVKDAIDDDPLLLTYEVAALFKVNPKTVARWVKAGRIPAIKTPGGHARIRRSAVEAFLNP